ncbi:MAG: CPBP family intramembrane metalloprotease [Armatimonadetes bacterium]|nr:CPBP family intramembrane metalloprotease [Armatimonadota bacterium]
MSGVFFLLVIYGAVDKYASQESGERSFQALQETLRYSVSLSNVDLPLPESVLGGQVDEQLQAILDEAESNAAESEEAARIALVAAYELGEPPGETALQTLAASDEDLSRAIAELYGGVVVTSDSVDELRAYDSHEFAVRLAQVHAKEMLDEDGGREDVAGGSFALALTAVNFAMLAAVALGLAGLVLFFVKRATGRWKPVGFASGFTHADADRYMMRFAFSFAALFAVTALLTFALKGSGIADNWKGVITGAGATIFILAMLRTPVLGKADGLRRLIGEKRNLWRMVGAGLFGYLTTVPLILLMMAALNRLPQYLPAPTHPLGEEMAGAAGLGWLPILLTAAIIAPLLEETIFRGLLFPAIASRTGRPILAVFVSAFLFAAIHPQGPLLWGALMAVGGVAAYLRYYTGSLIPSYTLHIVHNGAIVTVAMLLA